jgi:DNA/RNA-binding domain of Phe-tRNA-synthetase-like protein
VGDLSKQLEDTRLAVREMLRFGKYKPTGRSKPASEYLLRSAQQNTFPRINAAVDICNFISLKYMVPVSLWDMDLSETSQYVFRHGKPNESYIFNSGGQEIVLEDLICGFGIIDGNEVPMVNPVKDSLRTKTTTETRNIGSVVYLPHGFNDAEILLQDYHNELLKISENVDSCIIS